MIKGLNMTAEVMSNIRGAASPLDEDREANEQLLRQLLEVYPAAANQVAEKAREEGIEKGIESALLHQFTHRLSRGLTASERETFAARLRALGPERLGDVVLDLDAPALAAWLADPDAT
jgi:hypothetical protein